MKEHDRLIKKHVEKFVMDFNDVTDMSMLCIYNLNREDDAISFCGDTEDMVRPFTEMLIAAYDNEEHDGLLELVASIVCAFGNVIDEDNKDEHTSNFYRKMLQKLLDGEFKPKKKKEVKVEEKKEETFEELKAKLNKMGYNVSRKPTTKPQPKATKK